MNDKTAYPLCWPDGWPRTPSYKITTSRFFRSYGNGGGGHSMAEGMEGLQLELDRLGASNAILSTNVALRLDGRPRSDQAQPTDKGAAVYFTLKGKPVSLACDKWNRVECNVWALVKHIEAIRGQDRWGVGSVEQAFRGYMALPPANNTSPHKVLGIPINATFEQAKEAYRILAMKHHPDRPGGDPELFRRVQEAFEELERAA